MGGLMRRFRELDIVVLFLTALWLFMVFIYVVPLVLLLPLVLVPKIGPILYQKWAGWYDFYGRQMCMCIPFVWCSCRVHWVADSYDSFMECKEMGNSLILSNHSSRIDWLVGIWTGLCGRPPTNKPMQFSSSPRVNFVAEVTTALLPVIGWSRFLFGDILLQRAFHKDGPRILRNIKRFHDSDIQRCIFLAPEGAIADPGVAEDEAYIRNCQEFMTDMGKEPFRYVLTPRYKGMTTFVTHAPESVASVTMAFIEGYPTINAQSGVAEGGNLCTRSLDSPDRKIPDLFTLFTGGLHVFVDFRRIQVSTDPKEVDKQGESLIKTQLVEDQAKKDKILEHFEKYRRFPKVKLGSDVVIMQPTPSTIQTCIWLNFLQLLFFFGSAFLCSLMFQVTLFEMLLNYRNMFLLFFAINSISYQSGKWAANGISRESLVGETAFKAVVFRLIGRSANQGGKQSNLSEGSSESKAKKS